MSDQSPQTRMTRSYRVVDRDGRCTSTWGGLEHAREAMRNYDEKRWPERGPHRIQTRTTTTVATDWEDLDA